MKKWKCTVCGYVHEGDEPPEQCPVCGADRSKFVPMEEEKSSAPAAPKPEPDPQTIESTKKKPVSPTADLSQNPLNRLAGSSFGKNLTRWHGHPIAVHIPNGVLPMTVVFAFLAALLDSESLAVAAQYSIGYVFLFMPIVIGTGLVDWSNGFKARITRVFKIKMVCAGIVTVLSLAILIWGMLKPHIYRSGLADNWFFLLLQLANLAAASVAGWYGGKLVFRK